MSTYVAKPADIKRKWYVIDADGLTLGRLASEVAKILRGKNKPEYTPFLDTGDHVIVVNAAKITLSGNKADQKMYRYHTQYPGGLKEINYRVMMQKNPERVVELAVKGMLPKNALGRAMYRKLKVYAGPEHNHAAQKPEILTLSI
ncbi:MAG: 50S ribosomal protein L13 [Saccharofermentanales bacterium]|jgi:large subunit ribosomal protein L13|nr:50S ribosomal protein L13 [Clostridiaceae bacterium]